MDNPIHLVHWKGLKGDYGIIGVFEDDELAMYLFHVSMWVIRAAHSSWTSLICCAAFITRL